MARQIGTLAGKVAVITGSTQGFGLAIAHAYAGAGAAVVLSNHLPDEVVRAVERSKSLCALAPLRQIIRTCDAKAQRVRLSYLTIKLL